MHTFSPSESGVLESERAIDELKRLAKELTGRLSLRASLSRVLTVLSDYPCMARCLIELKPDLENPWTNTTLDAMNSSENFSSTLSGLRHRKRCLKTGRGEPYSNFYTIYFIVETQVFNKGVRP